MTQLRLLHVHSGNLFGGIETVLLSLRSYHDETGGFESEYALCFDSRLARELRGRESKVHILAAAKASRPWTVFRARALLGRLLATRNFDAVVTHSPWTQGIFGPVLTNWSGPCVFWLHGALGKLHWTERLARRHEPQLVVCNSNSTARTLPKLYPNARSTVIYNPVEEPQTGRATRLEVREQANTPPDAFVILLAGRMEALKGHAVLLSAVAGLNVTATVYCWFAGGAQQPSEQRYQQSLESQAAGLGISDSVRFLGDRKDIANVYAAADLYCQPNTHPEGFGVTFVEALYTGLPVVTTAIGGALEIIDESCGVLIDPDDVSQLVVSLESLIEDPDRLAALASAAPIRARQLCDPNAQLARIYNEVKSIAT